MKDVTFMRRALYLAAKGRGRVSPNPMVGCVIVKKGRIIAEGWHKRCGEAHAELIALNKIGRKAGGATMYVTLEPCHHFGKTPPCVDAVVASGVSRVVVAMRDPNPQTNGKSIRKLRATGVEVTVGVCRAEAEALNRFFIKHVTTGLPFVIAKVAWSRDLMISARAGQRSRITGRASQRYVQELRSHMDAVLVGRGTVLIDDPLLNVRDRRKPQPCRVILDSSLKLSCDNKILTTHGGRVILFCSHSVSKQRRQEFEKLGACTVVVNKHRDGLNLRDVLEKLGGLGVTSLLVEGGAEVFTNFDKARLVDEWQLLTAPIIIGSQGTPAFVGGKSPKFTFFGTKKMGRDILLLARQK